jgi:hypothetical protein
MAVSDVCIDPDGAITSHAPKAIRGYMSYYLTCVGDNPIGNRLNNLNGELGRLNETVNAALNSTYCAGDSTLLNVSLFYFILFPYSSKLVVEMMHVRCSQL